MQIVIPCSDFCMPEKECPSVNEDDPCKLFKKMKFPVNEFFPQSLNNMVGFSDDVIVESDNCARGNCRK